MTPEEEARSAELVGRMAERTRALPREELKALADLVRRYPPQWPAREFLLGVQAVPVLRGGDDAEAVRERHRRAGERVVGPLVRDVLAKARPDRTIEVTDPKYGVAVVCDLSPHWDADPDGFLTFSFFYSWKPGTVGPRSLEPGTGQDPPSGSPESGA